MIEGPTARDYRNRLTGLKKYVFEVLPKLEQVTCYAYSRDQAQLVAARIFIRRHEKAGRSPPSGWRVNLISVESH